MNIYLIKRVDSNIYKIGITYNLQERLKTLQTGSHCDLIVIHVHETKHGFKIEKALHNFFSYCRKNGEWFELNIEDENKFKFLCEKLENNLNILYNNEKIN